MIMFSALRCGRASLTASVAGRAQGSQAARGGGESPLRTLLDEASAFGEAEPDAAGAAAELQWATQPYAAGAATGQRAGAERAAPHDAAVLLFAGQGAERVGMGRALRGVPAARELYDLASDILGWDVWRVCTEGPADELARRAQAAVLVTSLAALEAARDERPAAVERARAAAGAGLGELAALVAAGALPLEGALRLAELRAAAMAAAAAARPAGRLLLRLAPDAQLPHALLRAREHAAARGVARPVCQVAAYLHPGGKVVAGDEEALAWLERCGARFGVRRAARLAGGAEHSALMEPTRAPLRDGLRALDVRAPRLAVLSCTGGGVYRGADSVRRGLERLAARPLRWEQTLHALFARPRPTALPLTLALGPGAAGLRAQLRLVNARAWDHSLHVDV